jgi:general secretion pathway protein A
MDRIWAGTDGTSDTPRRTSAEDFALPSRGEAIVAIRPTLDAPAGPILLTGEPGVGKTWLCRRLQAELPPPWHWVLVDMPPAVDPTTLYHLIGHCLGLPAASGADAARLALADFLREATADGLRWALVIDEAHNASAAVLEEVRILSNRLGRADGFAALVLVGQTELACRLGVRPLKALAARLSAHVHLRCLDLDEARTLLNCLAPTLAWDERTLERQHRDTAGNPRRLLQAAARASTRSGAPAASLRLLRSRPGAARGSSLPLDLEPSRVPSSVPAPAAAAGEDRDPPVVGPYKPPLLVGDGMVEVGWEGGLESESEPMPAPDPIAAAAPTETKVLAPQQPTDPGAQPDAWSESEVDSEEALEVIETIDDHYTALQAWNEWARNRGRTSEARAPGAAAPGRVAPAAELEGDSAPVPAPTLAGQPSVWVEGEQSFAPYGQLFSRLRQSRDVNESS